MHFSSENKQQEQPNDVLRCVKNAVRVLEIFWEAIARDAGLGSAPTPLTHARPYPFGLMQSRPKSVEVELSRARNVLKKDITRYIGPAAT